MSQFLNKHVSEGVWGDFIENRLPSPVAAKIQAHLDTGCEKCVGEWKIWKRLLGTLERSRAVTPPASMLQRAFDIFDTRTPQPSLLQRLLASLVFDSRQNALPALARASASSAFNLVYTANDANIHLWCEFDGLYWQVTGQASPAEAFWSVAAIGGGEEVHTDPDEAGEFVLPDLSPGQYEVIVRGATQEVTIPALQLEGL